MRRLLFIFSFFSYFYLNAQDLLNNNYYLINPDVIEGLSIDDKRTLDSCLNIYHESIIDTVRVNIINTIIDYNFDNLVSERFNVWLDDYIIAIITNKKNTKEEIVELKRFLVLSIKRSIDYNKGQLNNTQHIGLWERLLELNQEIGDKAQEASSYYYIGYLLLQDKKSNISLEAFRNALMIYRELNDSIEVAKCSNAIAYIYHTLGDVKLSLKLYYQSLSILEVLDEKEGIAACNNNIALIQKEQNNIDNALKMYNASLSIYRELGKQREIALTIKNRADIYDSQGELKKALDSYNEAKVIFEELNDKQGIVEIKRCVAKLYIKENKIKKSITLINDVILLAKESNDVKNLSLSYIDLGNVYYNIGELRKAEEFGLKGLEFSKKVGYPECIEYATLLLYKVYEKKGEGMNALEMYRLSITMRDSLKNESTLIASVQQESKYIYEKQKELDNLAHEKELSIENEVKNKQRILIISITLGLIFVILFLVFIFNRLRITKSQKNKIEEQKIVIEATHKEITDSIDYAKRLQDATLPSIEDIQNYIPNLFVYFKPKDIVSGDFYWFVVHENVSYIAVADCTGHGVPGSMVSLVCSNALNQSVKEFGLTEPAEILNKTRNLVIDTFAKNGKEVKDGMDISLCSIKDNLITFSGANNPLWIVRNLTDLSLEEKTLKSTVIKEKEGKALLEIKADKQPVGLHLKMKPFTQKEIRINKEDVLYLFTDGFADQFGGDKGKKLMYKPFKKMLIDIHLKRMEDQEKVLDYSFKKWKGNEIQIDDVCILGFNLN